MNGRSVERVVGADIGGANLKYASDRGSAHARRFALWQQADQLSRTVQDDLSRFCPFDTLAVTMTGELADCFIDREVGVRHIVKATKQAARSLEIDRLVFYGVDGAFHLPDHAIDQVDLIAAANWHALASYVGQQLVSDCLVIDVGSTTTDIILVRRRNVATQARSDHDRLTERSLVYVGCRRTPVCAVLDRLDLDGRVTPVMNETFATIDDARLLLGWQSECVDDTDTADGKPRTKAFAANRLARMIGLDRRQVTVAQATQLADQVQDAARQRIRAAIDHWSAEDRLPVVLCGHGQDLAELPSGIQIRKLSDELGADISRCAPAFAVARLCGGGVVRPLKAG